MSVIKIYTSDMPAILSGKKTVEIRLGTSDVLKIRPGDILKLHATGNSDRSKSSQGVVHVKQLLYFETIDELFHAVSYTEIEPFAETKNDVIKIYKSRFSTHDEYEFGMVAIYLEVK